METLGGLRLDPNPCLRYRWPRKCSTAFSGAHACSKGGGHAGVCVCGQCGALGRGKDRAASLPPAPPTPEPTHAPGDAP